MSDLLKTELKESLGNKLMVPPDLVRYVNEILISSVRNSNYDHPIFNSSISRLARGTINPNKYYPEMGGIFWTDTQHDLLGKTPDFPQLFGHTVISSDHKRRTCNRYKLYPIDFGNSDFFRQSSKANGRRGWLEIDGPKGKIIEHIEPVDRITRLKHDNPEYIPSELADLD